MKKTCYKCDSENIIPHSRFKNIEFGSWHLNFQCYKNPTTLILKGSIQTEVRADVCGSFGYIEMYVENPEELWQNYKH